MAYYAALITGSTLLAFWWIYGIDTAHAQTGAFMTLGMSQTFHLVNARGHGAIIGPAHFSNPYALAALMVALALQLLPVFVAPLGAALHVARLCGGEWAIVAAASVAPAVIGQSVRALRVARQHG